jgi:hypothetical protein
MPKLSDYSNGIIYKLVCNDLDVKDIYVGSTCDFVKRKYRHKSSCCNPNGRNYNLNVYQCIRSNGGWDNWSMVMVEKYPCKDRYDLHARERYWIENLISTLNKCIPCRTNKEYREQHKAQIKEYYEQHKAQINEQKKQYRDQNKETIKEQRKQYREQNKETIKEQCKQYREQNRETINAKAANPYTCICGSIVRTGDKSTHFKSIKHKKHIETQTNEQTI